MQPQGDKEIIIEADKKMIVNSEMWRESSYAKLLNLLMGKAMESYPWMENSAGPEDAEQGHEPPSNHVTCVIQKIC